VIGKGNNENENGVVLDGGIDGERIETETKKSPE
jgi:hypothetical protein